MRTDSCVGLAPLYLITDRNIAAQDLLKVIEVTLKAGVKLIQLREKDLSLAELRILALKVLKLTRIYSAKLLINGSVPGSVELALAIEADGVQLGAHSMSVSHARKILGPHALLGYSAHSSNEVETAASQGADFATFSPVYFTASKAQYGPPQGLKALRDICHNAPIPIYALGGIQEERINEVFNSGAWGVALISAVMAAADPQKAVQAIMQTISTSHARLRDSY